MSYSGTCKYPESRKLEKSVKYVQGIKNALKIVILVKKIYDRKELLLKCHLFEQPSHQSSLYYHDIEIRKHKNTNVFIYIIHPC